MNFMPIVELIRLEENYEHGTFGILKINKEVFCFTLEPRDEENAINISSIPAQQYECKQYSSQKYPDTFQITNVPGRDYILFHAGNTDDDTAGCILLGDKIGKLKGERAILNSGYTFINFITIINRMLNKWDINKFHLTIREVY